MTDHQIDTMAKAMLAADRFQPLDFKKWDTLPDAGYVHPPTRGRDHYRAMAREAYAVFHRDESEVK